MVGERYAMVTFNRVKQEGFERNAEDIKQCLKVVTEKVYSLIRTYSRTFRVDFSLEEIDALTPGTLSFGKLKPLVVLVTYVMSVPCPTSFLPSHWSVAVCCSK